MRKQGSKRWSDLSALMVQRWFVMEKLKVGPDGPPKFKLLPLCLRPRKNKEHKSGYLGRGWGCCLFPRDLGHFPGGLEGTSRVTIETGVTAVKNTHPSSVTLTSKRLAGLIFSQKGSQTPASTTAKPGGQLGVNMVWLLPWGNLSGGFPLPPGVSSKLRQDPWGPCDVTLLASSTWCLRASCSVFSQLKLLRVPGISILILLMRLPLSHPPIRLAKSFRIFKAQLQHHFLWEALLLLLR